MDLKNLGLGAASGGGVVAILLAMFQQQGVDMMSEKYKTEVKIVMERAIANSERINRIENRIDRGFDEVKNQVAQVGDVVREGIKSRWTKEDHDKYAESINLRLNRVESQLLLIKSEFFRGKK